MVGMEGTSKDYLVPTPCSLQAAPWHFVFFLVFSSKPAAASSPHPAACCGSISAPQKIINTSRLSKPRCFGWEEVVPSCWVRLLPTGMDGSPLTDSSPTGSNLCPAGKSSPQTWLSGTQEWWGQGRGTAAQPCSHQPCSAARDKARISLLALPGIPQAGGGSEKWEFNIPAQVSGQVSALILPRPDTWNQQLSVPKYISEWEIQEDIKVDREERLPLPLGTRVFHRPFTLPRQWIFWAKTHPELHTWHIFWYKT